MRSEPVLVGWLRQFAEVEPFQIQGQDAVLGEVDAPLLLVLYGLPRRAHMAVDVQDRGRLSLESLRLVKDGRGVKAGHYLVAQLVQPVALAIEDANVFEPGWGLH